MDFGRRLAKMRVDAGYTQESLAHASGLSQSAISQLESGVRSPTYKTIRQIARALNLPTAHLVGDKLERLAPRESAVLRRYRSLSEPARLEFERLIGLFHDEHAARERRPASRKVPSGGARGLTGITGPMHHDAGASGRLRVRAQD